MTNEAEADHRNTINDWYNIVKMKKEGPPDDAVVVSAPRSRYGNQTHFEPSDAPDNSKFRQSKQNRLIRQNRHNRDIHHGYRTDVDIAKNADVGYKRGLVMALGHQLEMPNWLIAKVWHQLRSLDLAADERPAVPTLSELEREVKTCGVKHAYLDLAEALFRDNTVAAMDVLCPLESIHTVEWVNADLAYGLVKR